MDFLQHISMELLALIAGTLLTATLLDDFLVDAVSKIPVIGKILAPIVRRITPRFRQWLHDRVPKAAEAAVQQAEGHLPQTGAGAVKKEMAVAALQTAEPGLRATDAEREIQAAFDRLVGQQKLAEQAAKVAPPATASGAAVVP